MKIKLILILSLLALLVLFILQNIATVEIQFLFWSTQMSRSLLMFVLLVIGMVIGWFLRSVLLPPKKPGKASPTTDTVK